MATAQPYRVILTTAESEAQADKLAAALVDRRLAACVNILRGVRSVYRWEGKEYSYPPKAMILQKLQQA